MNKLGTVVSKEIIGFFGSFTALGFFAAFLATLLFIFFWVNPFFVRNSADLRPIFETMPTLLIFLAAALTMKMWSEERRSGTLEFLLTSPISNLQLVMGKFFACLSLVLVAISLTLPLPVSIALFAGPLDWGPTIGGYIGSIFLAAAYVAIGLNVSARTDNQIVSLLLTILICSLLLILGSPGFVHLFNIDVAATLSLLGTGSRFQSITRGIIDFRDLYYYISLTGVFLSLNTVALERLRWAGNPSNKNHNRSILIVFLCVANFVFANFWLAGVNFCRIDLTDGSVYTLSAGTRKDLDSLKEPLLIRGYFSKRMHPLLQAAVPALKDLLKEYQSYAPNKIRVEFLDPQASEKVEKEAVETYGLKPVTFQSADKYQSSVVNAYFDVVLKYGDQYQKLNWSDLIEVTTQGSVRADLRNPEYDITRAIKKLVASYRNTGDLFLGLNRPVEFIGYISNEDRLPTALIPLKQALKETLQELKLRSQGKFSYSFQDPGAPDGDLAKSLATEYGYRPMSIDKSGTNPFFFYMLLTNGDQDVQVPIESPFTKNICRRSLEAGLKQFSKGFLKTIGFYQGLRPIPLPFGNRAVDPCRLLIKRLNEEYDVRRLSLKNGDIPEEINLLLLIAPEYIESEQIYAVDQFLMRGGTVIVLASPFRVDLEHNLSCSKSQAGLLPWLKNYGLEIEQTMVLDPQNFPFTIPTQRMVNKTVVSESSLEPYPYSVDIAKDGLETTTGINAGIKQLLFSWCSPISLDQTLNQGRHIYPLLHSSSQSWTSSDLNLNPQYSKEMPLGFKAGSDRSGRLLGVVVQGKFTSYFSDKVKPILKPLVRADNQIEDSEDPIAGSLSKSPESARIILFASNSFATDKVIYLMSAVAGALSLEPVSLIQNSVDWSLDDRELLPIRGRGNSVRALYPLKRGAQMLFEYMNYGLALGGLLVVAVLSKIFRARKLRMLEQIFQTKTIEQLIEVNK